MKKKDLKLNQSYLINHKGMKACFIITRFLKSDIFGAIGEIKITKSFSSNYKIGHAYLYEDWLQLIVIENGYYQLENYV